MKSGSTKDNVLALVAVKLAVAMTAIAAAASVTGCNTVKGVGHDITAVGQGGQDMIDDATGSRSTSSRR